MFAASKVAGAVSAAVNYIEDVFSTYLYNGNDTGQTITNNIDLSTKGGMVWVKRRSSAGNNGIVDTARGRAYMLFTNTTDAQAGPSGSTQDVTSFNTNGFSIGTNNVLALNTAGSTYASWTFRKQPKFFDCGTFTSTGSSNQRVPHSLGSTPGFIIIKATNVVDAWYCYHRDLGIGKFISLNTTTGAVTLANTWGTSAPTSTDFGVNTASAFATGTYVYYAYAHDAGGFGLTGTDNVISCGSFTTDGSGTATVNLGYEPQWVLYKPTNSVSNWQIIDNMRGFSQTSATRLFPNTSGADFTSSGNFLFPTATGFQGNGIFLTSEPYIYIAIRRGPMKVPTDATKMFAESNRSSTAPAWTSNFPVDWFFQRTSGADNWAVLSRLTGSNQLRFNTVDAATTATEFKFDWMNGVNGSLYNASNDFGWMMRRAPNFFDEVYYTGTGANRTVTHNLGVAPELMIVKNSTNVSGYGWPVYSAATTNANYLMLQDTRASTSGATIWNSTSPTSSVFTVGTNAVTNQSGDGYVAYLFATCAGVSKVGSYTGTGTLTTINCGFTGGARFVLIKRTDTTSDWFLWDTFRGMVAGTDPALLMNATTASANANSVYTIATGFQLLASPSKDVNTNGGTYIYLAIA